jgi:uncharacterized RDD family membrane protein YckC
VIVADLVTGEAVIVDVPLARFGSRMIAITLDLFVQFALLIVVFVLWIKSARGLDVAAEGAIALTVSVLVVVGYPTIFETLTRGRSPGKLALGLRVVSENGGPERFRQALLRALTAVIEIWIFLGSPALICSLLSAKGKRLGDVFAGTVVIQERVPARTGSMAVMPPELAGWAAGLELSGLQDQTAAMARQYLARLRELNPVARYELGNRIAAAVAATVSPPPPLGTPPDAYLSAVLAERRSREQARQRASGWSAPAAPSGPGIPFTPLASPVPAAPNVPNAPAAPGTPAAEPAPPAASEPGASSHTGFVPPQ